MMWQGPNGGHNRIVQSPGYVTILHEEYRDRRIIPVDGRPHGNIRQWFGDAVGRWEGDTLVVDTTNFLDRTNYEWANIWTRPSETLHLVERFKRIDADTLEYTITVEDPTTFTKPWTAVIPISRLPDDTQIYEYACHEGNYAMPNLLSGGRIDARARSDASQVRSAMRTKLVDAARRRWAWSSSRRGRRRIMRSRRSSTRPSRSSCGARS